MNNAAMVLARTSLEQLRASIPGRPEIAITSNAVGLAFEFTWDIRPRPLRFAVQFSLEEMVNANVSLYDGLQRRAAAVYSKLEGGKHDTRSSIARGFGRLSASNGKRRRGGKGEVLGCE